MSDKASVELTREEGLALLGYRPPDVPAGHSASANKKVRDALSALQGEPLPWQVEPEVCDDKWCGHRWCERKRAERGEHETRIQFGGTMGLVEDPSYQPWCMCGWRGDWVADSDEAMAEAEGHLR